MTDTTGQQSESTKEEEDELMENNRPEEQEEKEYEFEEKQHETDYEEEDDVAAIGDDATEKVFEAEVRKEAEQLEEGEEEEKAPEAPQVEMKIRSEKEKVINFSKEPNQDTTVSSEEEDAFDVEAEQEVQKTRDENALYLTKFLSNEEEDFSRLKMYIAQEGDSLEEIAERYEVQVTQLLKVNQMEQEEVQGGQVLYIPVRPVNNQ